MAPDKRIDQFPRTDRLVQRFLRPAILDGSLPLTRSAHRADRSRAGHSQFAPRSEGTLQGADYRRAMPALPTLELTGAPGLGKAVVAKEIGELLRRAGARHAVIDLDALAK
jgi:hypothetical protein